MVRSVIPRDLALAALGGPADSPGFPERYLERAFHEAQHLDERDRAFTVHLVQGVLRWRLRLDWMIQQSVRFPFEKIEPPILNILRIALYQIFFMNRVPESAAVNEAVKQATARGQRHVVGFVNGILRDICRRRDKLAFPDRKDEAVRYLSVFYSYPEWLVQKWINEIGLDSTEKLLSAGNRMPRLVFRVNRLRTDRSALIKLLEAESVRAVPTRYSPEGVEVQKMKGPVNKLGAFERGLFQVQSEAAQVCSHLLCPRSGEAVIDLCAGLGGKSTHLAEIMGDKGLILSIDTSHSRLVKLVQSLRRLGIDRVQPVVADAGAHLPSLIDYSFDKILVDGPCSGLGILSRHPDGKWTRGEGDIKRLAGLQKHILMRAAALLRRGGKMLYVTCTISREENEGVVDDFLGGNSGMVLEDLRDHIPEWGIELIDNQGFFRTFPHVHGMDGFFGALFTKKDTVADGGLNRRNEIGSRPKA
jgi:16S rRNA (cytosine967-C5)-methyltransferase